MAYLDMAVVAIAFIMDAITDNKNKNTGVKTRMLEILKRFKTFHIVDVEVEEHIVPTKKEDGTIDENAPKARYYETRYIVNVPNLLITLALTLLLVTATLLTLFYK